MNQFKINFYQIGPYRVQKKEKKKQKKKVHQKR